MEKKSGAKRGGRPPKGETDVEIGFASLLREREMIRAIEEIREEGEKAGQELSQSTGMGDNQVKGDVVGETDDKTGDIFAKLDDKLVASKVAAVREIQQGLEHSNKWMWTLKKQGAFKAFSRAKRSLEQYITPLPDALSIGFILQSELEGKMVADLGAGTGMLGITCLLAGAKYVHFFELDPDAFKTLTRNCSVLIDREESDSEDDSESEEDESDNSSEDVSKAAQKLPRPQGSKITSSYALHNVNVLKLQPSASYSAETQLCQTIEPEDHEEEEENGPKQAKPSKNVETPFFDIVIMNPPFGTSKDQGIDVEFLKVGDRLLKKEGTVSIFFVHKIARTKSLNKEAQSLGYRQTILWEFYLEVPMTMFDAKDFQDNFLNKEGETGKDKKNPKGSKGGKNSGNKHRFKQKKDVVFIRCCLVEWRREGTNHKAGMTQ